MFLATVAKSLLAKPLLAKLLQDLTKQAIAEFTVAGLAVAAVSALLLLQPSCDRYTIRHRQQAITHLQGSL